MEFNTTPQLVQHAGLAQKNNIVLNIESYQFEEDVHCGTSNHAHHPCLLFSNINI